MKSMIKRNLLHPNQRSIVEAGADIGAFPLLHSIRSVPYNTGYFMKEQATSTVPTIRSTLNNVDNLFQRSSVVVGHVVAMVFTKICTTPPSNQCTLCTTHLQSHPTKTCPRIIRNLVGHHVAHSVSTGHRFKPSPWCAGAHALNTSICTTFLSVVTYSATHKAPTFRTPTKAIINTDLL